MLVAISLTSCKKEVPGATSQLIRFSFPITHPGQLYPGNPVPTVAPFNFNLMDKASEGFTFANESQGGLAVIVEYLEDGEWITFSTEIFLSSDGKWEFNATVPDNGDFKIQVSFCDAARNDHYSDFYRAGNIPGDYDSQIRPWYSGEITLGYITVSQNIPLSYSGHYDMSTIY